MKKIAISLSMFLIINSCSYHQSKTTMINIKVNTISKLESDKFKEFSGSFYSFNIDIKNNTDMAIRFWIMTCSWETNFTFNTDSLYIFNPGCDSNYPHVLHLEKDEKRTFNGIIRVTREMPKDFSYKLGFILIRENEVKESMDFKDVLKKKGEQKLDIFWSEPFKIDK